jgi:hypothetical protein
VSPFYEIPWPVLLATCGAVVLLCLAAYVLGAAEEREQRRDGRGDDDRDTWRW